MTAWKLFCSAFISPPPDPNPPTISASRTISAYMPYNPRNSVDAPGTSPDRGMNARNFILIITVTVVVLLGVILTFALGANKSGASSKPADSAPAKSSGPSPQ